MMEIYYYIKRGYKNFDRNGLGNTECTRILRYHKIFPTVAQIMQIVN